MIMVWCSKKESPNQIKLPTEVIRQNTDQNQDIPTPTQNPTEEISQNENTEWTPVEEFDPVKYEEENDEIEELVDLLDELIQEQESWE